MKISIVGIGHVGSTLAYTVMLKELCEELALIHRSADRAVGDALDLQHATSFIERRMKITAGHTAHAAGSDIIAICASAPMPANMEDRTILGPANAALFRELIPALAEASPDAVFVIVSNPVDVLTYLTIQYGNLDPARVIGTGTLVDSMRFRGLLSDEVGIHPEDLRAYILGEHGAAAFPALSVAESGAERIEDRPSRREMFERVRRVGFEVFKRKGYTNYAIAMAAASIIESIARDERHTSPVSLLIDGYLAEHDVCLSLPAVIGREGIVRILKPQLDDAEQAAFHHAAEAVRAAIAAAQQGAAAAS